MKIVKTTTTKLGETLGVVIPMVEEIVKSKTVPFCIVGAKINSKKDKKIGLYFSTINDGEEVEELLYNAAKVIVEKYKDKFEKGDSNG